nr:MAG TPA: hypothetical protein [Caudoviricetes sp.]
MTGGSSCPRNNLQNNFEQGTAVTERRRVRQSTGNQFNRADAGKR